MRFTLLESGWTAIIGDIAWGSQMIIFVAIRRCPWRFRVQTTDRAVGLLQDVLVVAWHPGCFSLLTWLSPLAQDNYSWGLWLEFGQWFGSSQALLCDYNRALDPVVASWLYFANKRASSHASLNHNFIQYSRAATGIITRCKLEWQPQIIISFMLQGMLLKFSGLALGGSR